MTRLKTKYTLILTAIVILLCLASITGATLALFTSSDDDGRIGINTTSGSIKLDIVDADDPSISLVGTSLPLVGKDGSSTIIFEPGMTVHTTGFRIRNNGTIPINYIVYISKGGASTNFLEAFDFWITNDPTDRDAMIKLYEFDGSLEKEQSSDVYYLVLHMKETADNKYQDQEFTGVGITVFAVQGNVDIEDVEKE